MRWINALFAVAINAVPFYGVLVLDWSISTLLVLYWFENLLTVATTSARIVLHRRWTRKRGHWMAEDGSTVNPNAYLIQYFVVALLFTVGHGVFVGVIVLILGQEHPGQPLWQFSVAQFGRGALSMGMLLVVQFCLDLPALRRRRFAWLKTFVDGRLMRVFVLHVTLIFGLFPVAFTNSPLALLGMLIALKALVDVQGIWSATGDDGKPTASLPAEPPGWVRGGKLDARWRSERQATIDHMARAEEVVPAA